MAKIIPICSSSKGNSVLVCFGKRNILIDVGCSFSELNRHLSFFGYSVNDLSFVLITHGHSDHIRGLKKFTAKTNIPVYAHPDTITGLLNKNCISPGACIYPLDDIDESYVEIEYFKTSHDCCGSVGFTIRNSEYSFAYCTDLGVVTREVRECVLGAEIVFLESNYNLNLLNSNYNYPPLLKARIKSDIGHLSNEQSAEFSVDLVKNGTRRIILGHLSPENNTPALAYNCNTDTLGNHGIKNGNDYLLDIAGLVHNGDIIAI